MIRGILFDFDGTLFDSMFIWDRADDLDLTRFWKFASAESADSFKR